MNVNINIKIDYTINSIFDKGVFDRIVYKFNWHNITLVKGILTKFDIITTLPYLESIGCDYYTIVIEHIISGIIAELHEKLGIEIDKKELCDENMVLFENFISELEKNVKDIQIMLKKCTYKVVRRNKSYDKRKLVLYENKKKVAEAFSWGGWYAWNDTFADKLTRVNCRHYVLKNLYWLIGRDCDKDEWEHHIENLDSGKGVDGKTDKLPMFFNEDEKLTALESFENN
jgi:hypothetical protein